MEWLRIIFDFLGKYGVIIIVGLIAIIGFILKMRTILNGNLVEWLIDKVAEAEAYFGSDTGQMKLRSVYDIFVKDRPFLSFFISFEKFSDLVDIALEKFEKMLSEDEGIAQWFDKLKKEKQQKQINDIMKEISIHNKYIDDLNPDLNVDINVNC